MSSFGEIFCLTLITRDPELAASGDACGINRIGIDIERLHKRERQRGDGYRISPHTWDDLRAIAATVRRAALFVRLNPLHAGTPAEIETALDVGADVLMLPFFSSVAEPARFIELVAGRARVVPLLETAASLALIDRILELPGLDEVMIGLNDLSLQLGMPSPFDVLASPMVDAVASRVRAAGIRLAAGGLGRPDDRTQPVPVDLVYAQYPRLGATGAWVARSFFNETSSDWDFAAAVQALRGRLTEWAARPPEAWERARGEIGRFSRRATVL